MLLRSLDVGSDEFEAATGWAIEPEGACQGGVCVPLGMPARNGGVLDVVGVAERLRMALVHEPAAGLWALGPAALGDRALASATAPALELDDVDGRPFRLSSLRGRKVVLVSWAPY